ncbi:MAG: translation initiation factor IF-2 [Candidatus Metalachnospira sp.]|nr:translation initiation factor IF-2 [Candidatus Metalachnospira sp.]
MAKKRVYEVAKQLNISNKELIDKLKELGIEVNNHMSSIDDENVDTVTGLYNKPKNEEVKVQENKPRSDAPKANQNAEQPKKDQIQRDQSQQQNRPQSSSQQQSRPQSSSQQQNRPQSQQNRPQSQQNRPQSQQNRPQTQQNRPQDNRPQAQRNDQPRRDNKPVNSNQPYKKDFKADRNDKTERPVIGEAVSKLEKPDKNERAERIDRNKNNNRTGKSDNNVADKRNKIGSNNKNNTKQYINTTKVVPQPIKEPEIRTLEIPETLTVKELAEKIGKSGAEIVKCLMKKGIMAAINQPVDFETAVSVGEEYSVIFELEVEKDIFEEAFKQEEVDESTLESRPPVVVVMGHVDHGKTSLLDAIRHSHVTSHEAGGITQHIGAYTVQINGSPITFLDTPGHEAFTAMRMRGAQITDIAVLVVAADDGVMPQTVEAINHAKAAGVEVIVAINKMDKPSANPDRVKQELVEYGLISEDWGGETICVPVSAATKEGIDTLLEMIILTAELKELKANPNKAAKGAIIEAQLDKGRGPVATVLVQEGTLNIGDPIVAGSAFGKIRAMMDDKGRRVKKAGPSKPVEILGLSEVPTAGDTFYVAGNDKQARQLAESVVAKSRKDMIKDTPQKVSLDDLFNQIQAGNVKDLNIVVKADVQGSVEAVKQSLEKLSNEEVRIRIIHGGVGAITESDVLLAAASNAIIIGFNVRPEPLAKVFADEEKVDMRLYRVIYNAIEDITSAMKGMLDPIFEEKVIGHAEVRQLFKASGVGIIAGSYVLDGKFTRSAKIRILRDNIVIYEGELESLKRFKDDVKEVNTNYECGLVFKKFSDLKEGDIAEAFIMVEVPR